jgi:N-acetyl-beta-hexosaminidase
MPGHTSSWRNSHPELFADGCKDPSTRGAFDPAKPEVYTFLSETLADWFDVFEDDFVHIGTDEVPTDCWNNDADKKFIEDHGMKDANDLFHYFIENMMAVTKKLGRQTIICLMMLPFYFHQG